MSQPTFLYIPLRLLYLGDENGFNVVQNGGFLPSSVACNVGDGLVVGWVHDPGAIGDEHGIALLAARTGYLALTRGPTSAGG